MIYFISIFFPFIGLFMVRKPVSGYFNLITHLLILLGSSLYPTPYLIFPLWISIVLWSFFEINDFRNRKVGSQIVKQLKNVNHVDENSYNLAHINDNNDMLLGDSDINGMSSEQSWFDKYLKKNNNNNYLDQANPVRSRDGDFYDDYNNVNNLVRGEPELNNYRLRSHLNNQMQSRNGVDNFRSQNRFDIPHNRYHMSKLEDDFDMINNRETMNRPSNRIAINRNINRGFNNNRKFENRDFINQENMNRDPNHREFGNREALAYNRPQERSSNSNFGSRRKVVYSDYAHRGNRN